MPEELKEHSRTYHLKNMISQCCLFLLAEKITGAGYVLEDIQLGMVSVRFTVNSPPEEILQEIFSRYGFEPIRTREKMIVEQIKLAVVELIHQMNNVDSIVRKSDYLVEKLGMSYPYLSRIFSTNENITLEKYIILHKMERIKELILLNDYTLSEIAFMMDYSSVQYLSNQFRAVTGMTVTEFRNREAPPKRALEDLR